MPSRAEKRAAGMTCLEVWLDAAKLADLDAARGATSRAAALRDMIPARRQNRGPR